MPARSPSVRLPQGGRRLALARPALLLLILALLATSCSQLAPPEPVTIHFAYPKTDDDFYKALSTQFKKSSPEITVELEPKNDRGLSQIDPGAADVFVNSNLSFDALREAGKIASLDPWIENDRQFNRADFIPGTLALYAGDGKQWAIPSGVDIFVLYYNKDLFDQKGVQYPQAGWTWEDFLDAALKLRDPQANSWGYVSRSIADPALFIVQHGGQIVDSWQNPTRTTFDDPKTIEALEWWDGLVTVHKVAPSPDQARGAMGGGDAGIYSGKVGMWFGQMSERGGLSWPESYRWTFKWGMAPLPRDAQSASVALSEGYFISSKTSAGAACWKWLAFLSEQAPNRLAPARKSSLASDAYARLAGSEAANVARAVLPQAILIRSLDTGPFRQAAVPFTQAIDAITSGRATVSEALAQAQKAAQ